jgi:hypothetical protein
MKTTLWKTIIAAIALILGFTGTALGKARGIYLTQTTLEDTKKLEYLIKQAKATGLNTFVIDYFRPSKLTDKNIALVKESGLRYIARIVVFPDGASSKAQMFSESYREKKLAIIKEAIALGAQEIQLDYIRYNSRNRPSEQNVQDVNQTIKWYRNKLQPYKIPLQIDVFGITSLHHELRIGQYPKVFAGSVDTINPMVYPSHYEPYRQASSQPYKTVFESLTSLKEQLKDQPPVKIVAFIEASNYRYKVPSKLHYVKAQMKAVEDANINGWYVWSANNLYDHVFQVLKTRQAANDKTIKQATPAKLDSVVKQATPGRLDSAVKKAAPAKLDSAVKQAAPAKIDTSVKQVKS